MAINGIGPDPSIARPVLSAAGNGNSADTQIRSLEKKLKALQDDQKKAVQAKDTKKVQELEKKIQEIKKQIEELKRQKKKEEEEQPDKAAGSYGRAETSGTGDEMDVYA